MAVERIDRPTVEVRQGALDLIATSYRQNKGEYEVMVREFSEPSGELRIPRDPAEAFRLGNLDGLVRAGRLALELTGQKAKLEAIDRDIAEDLAELRKGEPAFSDPV